MVHNTNVLWYLCKVLVLALHLSVRWVLFLAG